MMYPNNQNFSMDVFLGVKLSLWILSIHKQMEQSKTIRTIFWVLLEELLDAFASVGGST